MLYLRSTKDFFYINPKFHFSMWKNQILKALLKINITTYEFVGKTLLHKCYLHISE